MNYENQIQSLLKTKVDDTNKINDLENKINIVYNNLIIVI